MIPRRGADKLLHPLICAATDISPDDLNIFPPLSPQQARQVMPSMLHTVHAPTDEMRGIALVKVHK